MNGPTTTRALTRRSVIGAGALLAASRLLPARAHDATPAASPPAGHMEMHGGTGDMSGTGAVFMTIANAGAAPDRLVAVITAAATTVEIHEVSDENGTMQMRPLADGLEIPAGGSVELEPGGYHVMLFGLKESLEHGNELEVTLTFEQAGEVSLTVPVIHAKEAASLDSDPVTAGEITVDKAWSRPAPAMGGAMGTPRAGGGMGMGGGMEGTSAAYMIIANAGAETDRLLSAASPAAGAVEVHKMADEGGTMVMRPLGDGLEIPAGGSVSLEPGGYHLMLIGLTEDLMPGGTISLDLAFEKAGAVTLEIPVVRQRDVASIASAPVAAGDITIDKAWVRSAPAISTTGEAAATPAA